MLVLSRKKNESIRIGDVVAVTVIEIRGDKVRLGIQNPPEVPVHRQEVWDAIHNEPYSYGSSSSFLTSARASTPSPAVRAVAAPPPSVSVDASQLRIDREQPLPSLKAHLRTVLGDTQFQQIQPLLDQLTETKGIGVRGS